MPIKDTDGDLYEPEGFKEVRLGDGTIIWNGAYKGDNLYAVDGFGEALYQWPLSDPYNPGTQGTESNLLFNSNTESIFWNDDGTSYYISLEGTVEQHDVTTPYQIEQNSVGSHSFSSDMQTATWRDDGEMIYTVVAGGSNEIRQFHVNTAFDITTVQTPENDTLSIGSDLRDMSWNDDGTILHAARGFQTNQIDQYTMSSSDAFDIGQASSDGSESFTSIDNNVGGVGWNYDGTRLFIIDYNNDLREFTVTTPFDVTTRDEFLGSDATESGMTDFCFDHEPQYPRV